MHTFSLLMPSLRQTTLLFGAASVHLELMPSEKTGGFASTETKITIPSSIVSILSLLRVAASTLNMTKLGDGDAHRRWKTCIACYIRDDKSSRPNNHKKRCRHLSGQSRG